MVQDRDDAPSVLKGLACPRPLQAHQCRAAKRYGMTPAIALTSLRWMASAKPS
jgi:hypothetical protein